MISILRNKFKAILVELPKLAHADFLLSASGAAALKITSLDLVHDSTLEKILALIQYFPQPYLIIHLTEKDATLPRYQRYYPVFLSLTLSSDQADSRLLDILHLKALRVLYSNSDDHTAEILFKITAEQAKNGAPLTDRFLSEKYTQVPLSFKIFSNCK